MNIPPSGYTLHLIGYGTSLEGIGTLAPLEESRPEGTLMLMQLDFEEPLSAEQLIDLNNQLNSAGVPSWPGYTQTAYTDQSSLYICWTKAFAFTSIIIGMLVFMVLPALLSIGLWYLMPESLKQMINMVVMVGVMMLMMKIMTPMMKEEEKPSLPRKEKEPSTSLVRR